MRPDQKRGDDIGPEGSLGQKQWIQVWDDQASLLCITAGTEAEAGEMNSAQICSRSLTSAIWELVVNL